MKHPDMQIFFSRIERDVFGKDAGRAQWQVISVRTIVFYPKLMEPRRQNGTKETLCYIVS
jgi:hypothetical protein